MPHSRRSSVVVKAIDSWPSIGTEIVSDSKLPSAPLYAPPARNRRISESLKFDRNWLGYLVIALVGLIAHFIPVPENSRSEGFVIMAMKALIPIAMGRLIFLAYKRNPAPLKQFRIDLQTHWPWLIKTAIVVCALAVTLETGSGIKKSIPGLMPFYADPFLIELDRAIFGIDPWRITHALFGWATPAFVLLYDAWHAVHIGLAFWIALSFDEARKIRFALCFQLSWLLLGGALATFWSSVGPVMVADFYPDQSFVPLVETLRESAPQVIVVKDLLIATMDDPLIISGISAMPSMHCAIAVLFALWLQTHGNRWLTIAGWVYAAAIYLISIHLGWHYATDGPVSAVAVLAMWWGIGKLQRALAS